MRGGSSKGGISPCSKASFELYARSEPHRLRSSPPVISRPPPLHSHRSILRNKQRSFDRLPQIEDCPLQFKIRSLGVCQERLQTDGLIALGSFSNETGLLLFIWRELCIARLAFVSKWQ